VSSPAPLLSIRQLNKSFGGLQAVNRLDVDVMAGEVLGLLGPNGSGKTTVMNLGDESDFRCVASGFGQHCAVG